jgi:hypothetical protein
MEGGIMHKKSDSGGIYAGGFCMRNEQWGKKLGVVCYTISSSIRDVVFCIDVHGSLKQVP